MPHPKKKDSTSLQDKRRYQRVYIGQAPGLTGAKASWQGSEAESEIFDLSYKGAAVSRPQGQPLQIGERKALELQLEDQKIAVEAEIMWFNERVVGLELSHMDAHARLVVDDYLSEKLVGLHLTLVPSEIMNKELGCSYWFSGPRDTSVFIWSGQRSLVKVVVEYEGFVVRYENKQWSVGYGGDEGGVQQQYQEGGTAQQQPIVDRQKILKKVVGMLSQIVTPPEVINQVIVCLKNAI